MGPIICPETSVRNYHFSLLNNPEGRSSQEGFCSKNSQGNSSSRYHTKSCQHLGLRTCQRWLFGYDVPYFGNCLHVQDSVPATNLHSVTSLKTIIFTIHDTKPTKCTNFSICIYITISHITILCFSIRKATSIGTLTTAIRPKTKLATFVYNRHGVKECCFGLIPWWWSLVGRNM